MGRDQARVTLGNSPLILRRLQLVNSVVANRETVLGPAQPY
jgi:hypothetical protein